ncbi:uncharacterized protein LOC133333021 [Musca vetustissima]|uniref:uncharacterized protein LOC133333021 n=1 Tax=Musca vetustissima TaxID=27455 RepID=UPI002AB7D490|nr:uncharacterized protein LOC133333021 [Musca vetustissima]
MLVNIQTTGSFYQEQRVTFFEINLATQPPYDQNKNRKYRTRISLFLYAEYLSNMGKHKNSTQDNIFLNFMRNNQDIARGFVKGDKVVQDKLWADLCDELNASGPPTKDIANWKKEEDQKHFKSIDTILSDIRCIKKEEIQELKRHNIQIERSLATKNEIKLKYLELEQLKLDMTTSSDNF